MKNELKISCVLFVVLLRQGHAFNSPRNIKYTQNLLLGQR